VNGFPGDEPLFATGLTEPLHEQHGDFDQHEEATHQEWEREHALQDRMNLRATFTEQQSGEDAVAEETDHTSREPETRSIVAASPAPERIAASDPPAAYASSAGAVQAEEIIEEEEADLTSYVEDLEEDATFEELEEETSAAEDYHPTHTLEIAATGEPPAHAAREEREHIATGEEVPATPVEAFAGEAETEEEAEEDGEEAEIEDAQAEAEALLEAEARGNSTVDARVEVRAPAGTAGYTQRARRPEFDRRRGRRGGRRFRSGGGSPRREKLAGSADQRSSERRTGGSDPDRERADRQERRPDHQPHRPTRPFSGVHADREPHGRVAQDLLGRGTAAPEAHHHQRTREWAGWVYRTHGRSGSFRGRTAC